MITDIDYPSQLPAPLREGYAIQHDSPLMRTQMQSGRARQRRRFTSVPSVISVSWIMTEVEAQLFEAWFRWTTVDGSKWFNVSLSTPTGRKPRVCRFTDIYNGPTRLGPNRWRFTAQLEEIERDTLGSLDVDFPDEIIYSDLLDKTMNKHWPEV